MFFFLVQDPVKTQVFNYLISVLFYLEHFYNFVMCNTDIFYFLFNRTFLILGLLNVSSWLDSGHTFSAGIVHGRCILRVSHQRGSQGPVAFQLLVLIVIIQSGCWPIFTLCTICSPTHPCNLWGDRPWKYPAH